MSGKRDTHGVWTRIAAPNGAKENSFHQSDVSLKQSDGWDHPRALLHPSGVRTALPSPSTGLRRPPRRLQPFAPLGRMNSVLRIATVLCLPVCATIAGCTPSQQERDGPMPARDARGAEAPRVTGGPEVAAPPTSAPNPTPPPEQWVEVFPGIRLEKSRRWVEFDGVVPINAHNADTPIVYLEAFVCGPDSKEHESLVMTKARPSHLHAALLAAGFVPGAPAKWTAGPEGGRATPAKGDALRVTFLVTGADGGETQSEPWTWAKHARTGATLTPPTPAFVFTGSRMVHRNGREWYDADGVGVLIGLHAWESEVIAWRTPMSPWVQVEEPVWIADAARVPKVGTPVRVRIAGE